MNTQRITMLALLMSALPHMVLAQDHHAHPTNTATQTRHLVPLTPREKSNRKELIAIEGKWSLNTDEKKALKALEANLHMGLAPKEEKRYNILVQKRDKRGTTAEQQKVLDDLNARFFAYEEISLNDAESSRCGYANGALGLKQDNGHTQDLRDTKAFLAKSYAAKRYEADNRIEELNHSLSRGIGRENDLKEEVRKLITERDAREQCFDSILNQMDEDLQQARSANQEAQETITAQTLQIEKLKNAQTALEVAHENTKAQADQLAKMNTTLVQRNKEAQETITAQTLQIENLKGAQATLEAERDETKIHFDQLVESNEKAKKKLEKFYEESESTQKIFSEMRKEKENAETQIKDLTDRLETLKAQLQEKTQALENAQTELQEKTQALENTQTHLQEATEAGETQDQPQNGKKELKAQTRVRGQKPNTADRIREKMRNQVPPQNQGKKGLFERFSNLLGSNGEGSLKAVTPESSPERKAPNFVRDPKEKQSPILSERDDIPAVESLVEFMKNANANTNTESITTGLLMSKMSPSVSPNTSIVEETPHVLDPGEID